MEDTLLRLSMIANVNDGRVKEAMLDDDEMRDIQTEAAFMAESKEVQLMLIQEKLARLDLATYGNDREAKGISTGISIGKLQTLWTLVQDGTITLDRAVALARMTEEEFLIQVKNLEKAELVTA